MKKNGLLGSVLAFGSLIFLYIFAPTEKLYRFLALKNRLLIAIPIIFNVGINISSV